MIGNDSAGFDVWNMTRVHWSGSCPAPIGVVSFEQPPTKWKVSAADPSFATTLKRGAPAPQCPPFRYSNPSVKVASTVMPFTQVMRAPDDEQSAVGPFFESRRPVCGSFGVVAFGPPLSGRPIPRSQAAVTMWLPAGAGAHSAAVPTNVNGTACTLLSSSATAEPGSSPTKAATVTSTNTRLIERLPLCVARMARLIVWPLAPPHPAHY